MSDSVLSLKRQVSRLLKQVEDERALNAELRNLLSKASEQKNVRPLDVQVGGSHYKDMAIQPVEYILANNIGFVEGNIIKYASRWKSKGGIKDLEKIKHFAELLIADVQDKQEANSDLTEGPR